MFNRFVGLGFADILAPVQSELIIDAYPNLEEVVFLKNIHGDAVWPYRTPAVKIRVVDLSKEDFLPKSGDAFFVSVVKPSIKQKLAELFSEKYDLLSKNFPSVVHPSVLGCASAKVEYGVLVEPGVNIGSFAHIGSHVHIKRASIISHHTTIESWSTINPGATICSQVQVGVGCTIGAGAVILDKVKIGSGTFIGAGSLVNKDIPAGVIAYGNPCKVIRENDVYQVKL
jgi:sugar O-acyltransferase (sialic acid O-acetyltransferase NeuD family)